MPRWTHIATGLGQPNDRLVLRDGETIARLIQMPHGPQRGKWFWHGQWVSAQKDGVCECFEDALKDARKAFESQSGCQT